MSLSPLVASLRTINLKSDEDIIISQVSKLLRPYISNSNDWFEERFYHVDTEQGFGSHLIAENPDHTLALIVTSWPQGRETPPHDHDTWAVIGCVKGVEKNILWNRHDDGSKPDYAKITPGQSVVCNPGEIITMRRCDIHSVVNPNPGVSVSLHIYGKHFNYTNRKKFDPINHSAEPFIVRQG